MESKYYGNTLQVFAETSIIGIAISIFFLILSIIFSIFGYIKDLWTGIINMWWIFPIFIFLIPFGLLPTFIQGIILENGLMKNVLFRKWIINTKKITDLKEVHVQTNALFPLVFIFKDKSKLRFCGAAVPEIQRLIDDLAKEVDNVKVVKGNVQNIGFYNIKVPKNWKKKKQK